MQVYPATEYKYAFRNTFTKLYSEDNRQNLIKQPSPILTIGETPVDFQTIMAFFK